MPQQIPEPGSLRDAVREVIRQNHSIGYRPGGFIQATEGGESENSAADCDRLIKNQRTFDILSRQIQKQADTLTLEDLIVHSVCGKNWGLAAVTLETAKARVDHWDKEAGRARWVSGLAK